MKDLLSKDLDYVLFHTEKLWERMRNKQVFITGGTGFFGSWIVNSFQWANRNLGLNAHAVVLTRNPNKFLKRMPNIIADSSINLVEGDVRNFQHPSGNFSYIIHAATESSSSLNAINPYEMLDTIVSGTKHVLDFGHHHPIEGFLYVSSGAVYGRQPPEISHLPETYLGGPNTLSAYSAYAEGKRIGELLCSINSSLNISIARCFTFVGPYLPLDTHYAIIDFINDGMKGNPILVQGDGTPFRSYLYAADLAIWLWTILFIGKREEAYNVGSPDEIQIVDVAKIIANSFSPRLNVIVSKVAEQGKPCERYVPDVQKAEKDLGLKANIPLGLAVERTIEWNRTNC